MLSRLKRITSSGAYIPEIDGLRFVAISAVVLFHLSYALLHSMPMQLTPAETSAAFFLERGALGVELFFAISGFILALPFLKALQKEGKVSLAKFYMRRVTRLEPPYILALIGIYAAALMLPGGQLEGETIGKFFARLFYLHDLIYLERPALNGVTWSLEIEVQFYLLVPFFARIFLLTPGVRRTILGGIILLGPLLVVQHPAYEFTIFAHLPFFLAGFLLADFYIKAQKQIRESTFFADVAALGLILCITFCPFENMAVKKVLPSLIVAILVLIYKGVAIKSFLKIPWVGTIGGMCYTIYLLHYPFISAGAAGVSRIWPGIDLFNGILFVATFSLPLITASSLLFFLLLERPCMNPSWPAELKIYLQTWRQKPAKIQPGELAPAPVFPREIDRRS